MTGPKIHTYHCLCLTLLLASTHSLSALPRRSTKDGALDSAIILPVPSAPLSSSSAEEGEEPDQDLPPEGYSLLLGLEKDKKTTIVRREDGFEKRLLHRCSRCRLVVGYELATDGGADITMADVGAEKGKGREEGYTGKVIYILPASLMSTDTMVSGRKIAEEEVDIDRGRVAVFE
jgi:hypothetical protein